MISVASFVAWSVVYLLGGMAGAAAVMALVLSPWLVRQWWIGRDLRSLDDPLPGHAEGPLAVSRRARRQLHRDLALLLVLNTNHAEGESRH